jgi:hypothetical protein
VQWNMLHGSRIEPGMTAGVGDDDNLAKSQIISQAPTAMLAMAIGRAVWFLA